MRALRQAVGRRITQSLALKPSWSRLKAPLASITFDDFPRSAWTVGGAFLRRRGVKATYYVSGGMCGGVENGQDCYHASDLADIVADGHELGCHTYSHERGPERPSHSLVDDVERNAAFIEDVLGDYPLQSFAFPYGDASPRTKLLFKNRFATSRGIGRGVNSGLIDLSQLKAIGLESGSWRPEIVEEAVAAAQKSNGWVIFFTHEVTTTPSPYGSTPAMVEHLLDTLAQAGMEVLPVKDAASRVAPAHPMARLMVPHASVS
jgi:peptidoglycan/xylan/chitin deacetylase (PgdA/CDA1 family)